MNLTAADLNAIRQIVKDETLEIVQTETPHIVEDIVKEVVGLELAPTSVRVQEIYRRLSGVERRLVGVEDSIEEMSGTLIAVEDDVKDIYKMLKPKRKTKDEREFQKLSLEKQILFNYQTSLQIAQKVGVTLPKAS